MTTRREQEKRKKDEKSRLARPRLYPYAYLTPAWLSLIVLSFIPIVATVIIAFTNFSLNHLNDAKWVGLQNFRLILAGPFAGAFFPLLAWTFMFAALSTVLVYALGLFLATLLNNKNMRESYVYRALLIIPWAVPGTIAVLSWSGVLNQSAGAMNAVLHLFGLQPIPWLNDPLWAKVSMIGVNLWLGYPFMMNAALGALSSIPEDLYESADLDGAGWWQKMRWITLPLLTGATLPLLISTFGYNFNNFGMVYLLTGGGPPSMTNAFVGKSDILISAAYKMTLTFNRYDLASAFSLVIFAIVAVITAVNMKATHAFEEVD